MEPTKPCDSHRNCVSRRTSKRCGFASKEMGCSFRPSSPTGHRSSRCRWTYQMIFWRAVTIRLRNHATRYDGVYAGYGYLQLHHRAPTSDSGREVRETRRNAERVRDYRRGVTFWSAEGGSTEARRSGRGVLGTACDSRLDQ